MLQFIVLGLVPGTHIELTFSQISLLLISFYAGLYIVHVTHPTISLSNHKKVTTSFKGLASNFGHKALALLSNTLVRL